MKTVNFKDNEVVEIKSKEQFYEIYKNLRSFTHGSMSIIEWLRNYGGYPEFPIYLEHMYSVTRGHSIGYTTHPDLNKYNIISFEQSTK